VRCLIVTGWNRWRFGWLWRRFWRWLSESFWCRCTRAFASPACLGILCCAILARKAAVCLIFPKHSRVSFHRSLHIFMPRKLNSLLLPFSDFCLRFLDWELHFLYCGARNPPLAILAICKARRMSDCSSSLPCHSCRHVENLQEISCCTYRLDSAITSTMYASVASSNVVKACLVHSRRFSSLNSSAKIPQLATS